MAGAAMTDVPQAQVADELCEDCRYEPELKQTLGPFGTYDQALTKE